MFREVLAIDVSRCVGCQTCVVACQMEHALRPGVSWLRVDAAEWGTWPSAGRAYISHSCLHCDDPACVAVCPTGASYIDECGTVQVDPSACIGCQVCQGACPYGARTVVRDTCWFYDAPVPAPYESGNAAWIGAAQKCTLCRERREEGRKPACVEACPFGARVYADPDSLDEQGVTWRPVSRRVGYLVPLDVPVEDVRAWVSQMRSEKAMPKSTGSPAQDPNPAAFVATAAACAVGAGGLVGTVLAGRKRDDARRGTRDV